MYDLGQCHVRKVSDSKLLATFTFPCLHSAFCTERGPQPQGFHVLWLLIAFSQWTTSELEGRRREKWGIYFPGSILWHGLNLALSFLSEHMARSLEFMGKWWEMKLEIQRGQKMTRWLPGRMEFQRRNTLEDKIVIKSDIKNPRLELDLER